MFKHRGQRRRALTVYVAEKSSASSSHAFDGRVTNCFLGRAAKSLCAKLNDESLRNLSNIFLPKDGLNDTALGGSRAGPPVFFPVTRNNVRSRMCTNRKIIWSLLVLSVLEIGLGISSIVLGAVGIIRVRPDQKIQQGDASPVWSGMCVRFSLYLF